MSNLVNIVVETRTGDLFSIKPDTSETLKNKKVGRIFRDSILSRSAGADEILEHRWSFKLLPGVMSPADVKEGHLAIIKAPQYEMGENRYDLGGYGIPCLITKYGGCFPLFRAAHMAEKWIYVDDELREDYEGNTEIIQALLIHTWPIVEPLSKE